MFEARLLWATEENSGYFCQNVNLPWDSERQGTRSNESIDLLLENAYVSETDQVGVVC
jgi:hypothetical protein